MDWGRAKNIILAVLVVTNIEMDNFFTQKNCDRCGKSLKDGRIQSMFNSECICMDCKKKECANSEYKKAQDADIAEIRKGNYNFKGIRG